MYTEITERFKEDCREINDMVLFIFVPLLLFALTIAFSFICYKENLDWLSIVLLIVSFILSALNCYGIVLLTIRKNPKFSKKKFWRILSMIDLYKATVHKKDIRIMIEILKDEGVNTRPKVLEVLRHYQCYLPRKVIGGSQIISILALSISTLAFIFSDILSMSFQNQIIAIICIVGIIIVYILGYTLNKSLFHYFGESALYLRIESAVSEIWMKSLIK